MYFMTGLDTIVEQILQEAQKEAEEIKAQAARNADSIIANAKKTVDKMNEETGEKVAQGEVLIGTQEETGDTCGKTDHHRKYAG